MDEKTTFADYEKGKKGSEAKRRRGPVRHISVKPVAGGFITEHEHEDMSDGSGPMYFGDLRTKKHHKTAEDMGSHVAKMFGGRQLVPVGEEAEEESESSGAGDTNED